jgi:protocatechuate 3,4-dioxygenase beta subunit
MVVFVHFMPQPFAHFTYLFPKPINMDRKKFLKDGFIAALGASAILPLTQACTKDSFTTNTGGSAGNGSCSVSPTETTGPFPTKVPSSLVSADVRSDRTGVALTIKITVNKLSDCSALKDAIVDIWHCDKDGYYSEYGGTSMQTQNFTSVHFLRGRQVTDASGIVTFTSIFPGWYSGRAPHIHIHIYNASGTSLLVTQIAFPTDVCNNVYSNATNFYTKGLQDTSNARDNVFSDSLANQLASVSGSIAAGYTLTHLITVNA